MAQEQAGEAYLVGMPLKRYIITTEVGERVWWADDIAHALEQHLEAHGGKRARK